MKKYLITTLIAFNLYSVSYSTNSLPDVESQSGLLTLKYQTPLQKDAEVFIQSWNDLKKRSQTDESKVNKDAISLNSSIVLFIDQIIEADKVGHLSHNRIYDSIMLDMNLSTKYFKSIDLDLGTYRVLYKHWKKLIYKQSPNAFASYIIGYLNSPFCDLQLEKQDVKVDFKVLLAAASRKHYLRATQTLLERVDWRTEDLSEELLEQRIDFFRRPDEAILSFIKSHGLMGEVQARDLAEFRELLGQISQNQQEYDNLQFVHRNLKNFIVEDLILRKSKPIPYRTDVYNFSNVFNASAVSITVGASNLETNHAIGIVQIASGIFNVVYSSLASRVHNWFYHPRRGHLLPSWYSDGEIALQSDLIALAFVIKNHKRLLSDTTPSKINHCKNKIVRGILRQYQDTNASLCSTIVEDVDFMSAK